jgi:pyruvate,water dikinase
LDLGEATLEAVAQVGGKNASLGEMVRTLGSQGIRIPEGFALTAEAFRLHLSHNGLADQIYRELDAARSSTTACLVNAAAASARNHQI